MRSYTIDSTTGHVRIDGGEALVPGASFATCERICAPFTSSKKTFRNGFSWVHMKKGLSLGDLPSSLSVCCGPRGLERMSFGVSVPNPVLVDGWPSRETTEREISAMQNALSAMLGRPIAGTASLFPWGSVFAGFNERDVCAAAGLTYLLGS